LTKERPVLILKTSMAIGIEVRRPLPKGGI